MTRYIYNGLLVVIGIFAVLSGGLLPYTIFITIFIIRLAMIYTLKQNLQNLFMMSYTEDVILTAGEAIDVEYKVTNTGLMPIAHARMAFQFSEKLNAISPLKEIAFFNSYQMINFSKKINCLYHGYYRVGSVEVQLYDPLLLSSKTLVYDKSLNITVRPKIVPLETFGIESHAAMGIEQSPYQDHTDRTSIQNIRLYQRGDALKDIHWKVSAKRSKLHTKTFEQVWRKKCVLVIDGFQGYRSQGFNYDEEEVMVSFAASLAKQIVSRDIHTSLYTNGRCIEGNTLEHFNYILDAMTGFSLTDDIRIDEKMESIIVDEGEHQHYILIVPMLRNHLIDFLIAQKNAGVEITVFIVQALKPQQNYLMGRVIDQRLNVNFLDREVLV